MKRLSRVSHVVGEIVLWIAGVAGIVTLLLAILGTTAGFGVVLFRTGSMSPTIDAGAAALVRTTAAEELHRGDVVTVDRPGKEPVTHRIIHIESVGRGAARALTLQGDANAEPDPHPYEVEHARRVLFSVPNAAPIVSALSRPEGIATVTLIVGVLIIWTMWPTKTRTASTRQRGGTAHP